MKDLETKKRYVELRALNWSYDRIAKELGVSKPILIGWSREFKIEIDNLKSAQLSDLQERYSLTKLKRLELFGQSLNALKAELDGRDLSHLPTEKLLELILKYGTAIKQEEGVVRFRNKCDPTEAVLKSLNETEIQWDG